MFELTTKNLLILFFIITFVTILTVTYFFSDKQKIIRTLKKLKSSNINNVRQNELVKITGKTVNIHEPLRVPMSNRKCVYYTMKIEQEVGDDDDINWKTLIAEEKIQDFFLEKNGEKIIIRPIKKPKNYISHLVVDKKVNSGTFNDASPKFERLLKTYDIKSTGFWF